MGSFCVAGCIVLGERFKFYSYGQVTSRLYKISVTLKRLLITLSVIFLLHDTLVQLTSFLYHQIQYHLASFLCLTF